MRCLSLWQPWATAMVLGHKANETRSWPLRHEGPLLIHAAKRSIWKDGDAHWLEDELQEWLIASGLIDYDAETDRLPYGAIIGSVDAGSTWRTEIIAPRLSQKELAHGNYADGRFALVTRNPVAFPVPIPYRGQQGFFDVPESALNPAVHVVRPQPGLGGLFA